ncbi:MAG TPA: host attachment protein [Acidimicrobiales bacterium]|nr:host attachment protein [Acidimicrobiales bacterium]
MVSLYLDVDGKRWPRFSDCEARLDRLVKEASERASAAGHDSAVDDLRRIQAHVRGGLDRSRARGLALFASGEHLWEFHPLPVRVKDQVVVNQTAHVRQLERVVDTYPGFGVLLADKQRARMFVFELNQLVDKTQLFDALPRGDDESGDRDRVGHLRNHVEEAARQHLKRAAAVAFEAWKDHPFDHLIVGAAPEIIHDLEGHLHTYLRDRIAARINVPAGAPESEITAAALAVEEQVERDREAAVVEKLRGAAAAARGGVVGLEPTLAALSERRVDTLVVSEGYEAQGWRCTACRQMAVKGRRCSVCGGDMDLIEDIVEEAVEDALLHSCQVEMCVDNADLDVAGRIGALLRF